MDKPFMSMSGNVGHRRWRAPIPDQGQRYPPFMADVIDASRQVPVLVDFWAPVRPLQAAHPGAGEDRPRRQGRTRLVKINVDENQQLAAQRIQSIPAVFAFVNGRRSMASWAPCPRPVKKFASRPTAPTSPRSNPSSTRPIPPLPPRTTRSPARYDILGADRENLRAIAGLARAQIGNGDLDGARATPGAGVPGQGIRSRHHQRPSRPELAATPVDSGEIARLSQAVEHNPADHQARHDLAVALNAADRREEALDHLLGIVRRQRDWNDHAARKQLVRFFEAWGPKDELTVAGRKRLSSILFS